MTQPVIAAPPDTRADLHRRLARIEGQVRGVQRMLDEGRSCQDILQQMAAIRAAVQQASIVLVRSYACECLMNSEETSPEKLADTLIEALTKLP